ncbi:MAG: hypothetical protein P4L81_02015, partial [Candidatus Pacebacteria bacterium]|nr:hypothetical protein [Candidatus Paceibacterota bacterium]
MEATDRPPAGGHTPTLATSFSAIPSAVLRYLATNFLEDAEACRWSQTELGLQSAMTNYVLKAP